MRITEDVRALSAEKEAEAKASAEAQKLQV